MLLCNTLAHRSASLTVYLKHSSNRLLCTGVFAAVLCTRWERESHARYTSKYDLRMGGGIVAGGYAPCYVPCVSAASSTRPVCYNTSCRVRDSSCLLASAVLVFEGIIYPYLVILRHMQRCDGRCCYGLTPRALPVCLSPCLPSLPPLL